MISVSAGMDSYEQIRTPYVAIRIVADMRRNLRLRRIRHTR